MKMKSKLAILLNKIIVYVVVMLCMLSLNSCGSDEDRVTRREKNPNTSPVSRKSSDLILGEWRLADVTSIFLKDEIIKYFPEGARDEFRKAKDEAKKKFSSVTFQFAKNGDYRIEDMNRKEESGKYEIRHEGKGIDFKPDDPTKEASQFDIVEINSKKMTLLLEIPLEGGLILPLEFVFQREGSIREEPKKRGRD